MTTGQIGYRVVGTVKSIGGECTVGHKVGDQFELSIHSPSGLCGNCYYTIFPAITMLQFGGGFPPEWGDPDAVQLQCPSPNFLKIELRRIR